MKKVLLIALIITASAISSQAQTAKQAPATGTQAAVVRFYPNPATTVINFDFQKISDQGYSIQIFNAMLGRKMFEQGNLPERLTINLGDFPRGVYVYQLFDKSGRMVESNKFQIAK